MKRRKFTLLHSLGLLILIVSGCDGSSGGSETIDSDLNIAAPVLTGFVINTERIPIPGAVVKNEDSGEEVTSDSSGRYELPIAAPGVCASASYDGVQQALCVDSFLDPNLSPQLVVDFTLDVPTSELPEAPPVEETERACGGLLGLQCLEGEYCDFPIGAICGAADATGVCKDIPEICTLIFAPVCGCDGQTYASDCTAAASGVSVAAEGECVSG